jgi:hypothetical protein
MVHGSEILLGMLKSGPGPCPAVKAHVKRATQKRGTDKSDQQTSVCSSKKYLPRTHLTIKSQRSAGIERNRKGNEIIQNSEKVKISGAVIDALAGREFKCHVLKDGHIASSIHLHALPPKLDCTPYQITQTTARMTIAIYAPHMPKDALATTGKLIEY